MGATFLLEQFIQTEHPGLETLHNFTAAVPFSCPANYLNVNVIATLHCNA
jgi:hypothetical protein